MVEMLNVVRTLVEPILEENDVYLDELVYEKEGEDFFLRFFVEKNTGLLDMETCVAVSEAISAMLDEKDPVKGEYILEVSSPGAEKPLRTYEQVVNHVDSYVYMQLINPTNGLNEVEGTLISVDGDDLEIAYLVKNIKKKMIVDYKNVKFIRLAVKF